MRNVMLRMGDHVLDWVSDILIPKLLKLKQKKYAFVLLAFLIALSFLFIIANLIQYDYQTESMADLPIIYQAYEYTVDVEELNSIQIDWHNGNIELVLSEETDLIRIKEFSKLRLSESQQLVTSSDNAKLTVTWKSGMIPIYLFQNLSKKLRIEIPAAMAENLESFTCHNASGNIDIGQINAKSIEISSHIGSIINHSSTADSITVHTGSGNIHMDSLVCSILELSTTTGDISCTAINSDYTIAKTTAGLITLQGHLKTSLEIKSITGDMQISSELCPLSTDLQSVRGTIELNLPSSVKTDGFELEYYIGEGSLDLPFGYVNINEKNGSLKYGEGKYKINLTTTNGKMAIRELTMIDRNKRKEP